MSQKRSAIRDRLRRPARDLAIPGLERDDPAAAPPRISRRRRTLSLSPPRRSPSDPEGIGVVCFNSAVSSSTRSPGDSMGGYTGPALLASQRIEGEASPSSPLQANLRQRLMASERLQFSKEYEHEAPNRKAAPTGVTAVEFTCVAVGFMIMLLFTYMVQHAVRSGYLHPPHSSLTRS
eukprot:jgi/Tetstr1/420943/TSEL_012004.t1